jgi:pyruvate/2-oxoglutarate dehydrogenase complex dihydrolipoamide acyltransferase (E2) component
MRCELRLTKINPNMTAAVIECIYAKPGTALKVGDKICDLSVDLSSGFSQYCPPISYFRVVAREKIWLQKLLVVPGDNCDVGQLMAVFSAEQDDPGEGAPARPLRITTAGIAHHAGMWSTSDQ